MRRYSINHNGESIDFEIVHRPAVTRRIHLEVGESGELQVVAPRRMSRRAIQDALQQRAPHVARFLVKARSRQRELVEFRYCNREEHPFMGQWFPLEIARRPGEHPKVELSGERLLVCAREAQAGKIRNLLQAWYRTQAQTHFMKRLARFSRAAPWTEGKTPEMRLRRMKRTWGNCSSRGVITLNPHLVKAPPQCIDYVIAHEVCHLREHNHGKGFYQLQEQLYPGWRDAKKSLTTKGHIYLHQ